MNYQLILGTHIHRALASIVKLLNNSLFVNSGYLLGIMLLGSIGGVFFWGLSARLYSPNDVGLATAILSISQLLSGIAGLGLGIGLVRFLTSSADPQEMLNNTLTLIVLSTILVGVLYLLGIKFWTPTLNFLSQGLMIAIGFIGFLVITSLASQYQAVFIAYRESRYAFWQVTLTNISRIMLVIVFISAGAQGIVAAVAVGMIFAIGISQTRFLPIVIKGYRLRPRLSINVFKSLMPYSFANHVADFLYRAPVLITPPLVLELLGAKFSAHVYIAWMLGSLITSPGQALAGAAFAEGSNTPDNLRQILIRSTRFGVGVTVLLAAIVGIGSPWALELFGKSYSTGIVALFRLFAIASPFMVVNMIYFTALRVLNKIGELILLSASSAVITLAITYFGIQHIGLESIGLGWMVAQVLITLVASRHYFLNRFNLNKKNKGIAITKTSADTLQK
ncbi:MAG TPA: hypothetical protein VJ327_05890 [Patescibacteria group bacterium]|nr:hypothetical protein [Patescibacteria group bacterium]